MTVFDEFRRILKKHKDIMPVVAVAEILADIDGAEAKWNNGWNPCSEQMPPKEDGLLLVQCSGKPRKNVVLHNAFELAIFDGTGWYFPMYPIWDDAEVIAWMPLPAQYQKNTNVHSRCDTCEHYIVDKVPPICYLCCKGIEDNYKQKGE